MKKLLIAAAIVCAAAFAQAATVKWSSGVYSGGFADHNGDTMKGMTDYTMTVYVYSDNAGTTLIDTTSSSSPNNGGAYMGTIGTDLSIGTTYYAKAIITDGTWTRESELAAFGPSDTGTPTITFISGANFDTSGNKWGDWQSVPEPTSGLLLLIGVAGLALKRRRA